MMHTTGKEKYALHYTFQYTEDIFSQKQIYKLIDVAFLKKILSLSLVLKQKLFFF